MSWNWELPEWPHFKYNKLAILEQEKLFFLEEKIMIRTILTFLLLALPFIGHAHERREVQTEQLKQWYDQKKPMIVLDARSKPYFNGTLLPNAKWVSAESSEKEIQAAAPSKSALIVVYCAGVKCPASGWLYDKMVAMGYTNVYEYHQGLQEWTKRGFPVTKQ